MGGCRWLQDGLRLLVGRVWVEGELVEGKAGWGAGEVEWEGYRRSTAET